MNNRIVPTLVALAAWIGFIATAAAQRSPDFVNVEVAAEVLASKVTLPTGPNSSLVMPACGGCPPKSYKTTDATVYFIGEMPVSLAELAAAIRARPNAPMTVKYSVKTGKVTRVTADIEEPAGSR